MELDDEDLQWQNWLADLMSTSATGQTLILPHGRGGTCRKNHTADDGTFEIITTTTPTIPYYTINPSYCWMEKGAALVFYTIISLPILYPVYLQYIIIQPILAVYYLKLEKPCLKCLKCLIYTDNSCTNCVIV